MTVVKDIHGKSRYCCCFFISSVHYSYTQIFECCLVGLTLILMSKSCSNNTLICTLCPFAQLMSTNTEPNPQFKHKGLPCAFRWSLRPHVLLHFLSFVHYQSFFQCPPTHPFSSDRAILGFEHIRQHHWRTHPTHQQ